MATTRATATRHGPAVELAFGLGDLRRVRRRVTELCRHAGFDRRRAEEITVAVNELAANSVDHGGGRGMVRAWLEGDALVVEVADAGHLADPERAGRTPPRVDQARGRGLWLVRQLTDSLDIRPTPEGTLFRAVVRR